MSAKRRFQVFVSSTYEDLREERQAAVEAILKAGHIPAGMELFTAGSESQLEIIRQWIRDSDIYMLILGGRYGSIEPKSKLSYTEVEFDYARQIGKPFFSVVLSDAGKNKKVRKRGLSVVEQDNSERYKAFRAKVLSHMCAFFENSKDVKLAIFETLPQIVSTDGLVGWVQSSEIGPANELGGELARSLEENRSLRNELEKLRLQVETSKSGEASFLELSNVLLKTKVPLPEEVFPGEGGKERSLLGLMDVYGDDLARGVSNSLRSSKVDGFLLYGVAAPLATYGLVEHAKVPANVYWQRMVLSKEGVKFLKWVRLRMAKNASAARPKAGTEVKSEGR